VVKRDNHEIKVTVSASGKRKNFALLFRDPISGKRKAESAGTADRAEAERAAERLEEKLNSGVYKPPSKVTWAEARERYEQEKLSTLAPWTQHTTASSLNAMERILNPDRLAKLTPGVLSKFSTELRTNGAKPATVAKHLRDIKAMLRWCAAMGMLVVVPKIEMPRQGKGSLAKGRAITGEEFDRMIAACDKVRPRDAGTWKRFLRGLWLSGLRLGEALQLSWDGDAAFAIDLRGKRPVFKIASEAQKSRRTQTLPLTPDFAQWLLDTPMDQRSGAVFRLGTRPNGKPYTTDEAGCIVTRIGKRAGVVVHRSTKTVKDAETGKPIDVDVVKYASSHDLRRSFGTRWAMREKPAVLQLLMRHASITTTLAYYVNLDVDEVAEGLWERHGNESANIPANTSRKTGGSGDVGIDVNSIAEAGIEPARAVKPRGF